MWKVFHSIIKKEIIMIEWIKDRIAERTSWDGGALIAVGVITLFFSAIIPINLIAWAAIVYGAFTLLKSE
jgi:hypothetical protein